MREANPLRVAVWSESRLFAEALAATLGKADGIASVALFDPAAAGRVGAAADVVVVDAAGGPERARGALRQAGERARGARLVAVGVEREDEGVVTLVESGAVGYVLRSASPSALVAAVRAAHRGRTRCASRVLTAVRARLLELAAEAEGLRRETAGPLSRRQQQILGLLAQGLGNKEIAQRLAISVNTVKNHIHGLLDRLGVHRRREAIRVGLRERLLEDHPGGDWTLSGSGGLLPGPSPGRRLEGRKPLATPLPGPAQRRTAPRRRQAPAAANGQ